MLVVILVVAGSLAAFLAAFDYYFVAREIQLLDEPRHHARFV
jgi:hypothetical protein